MRLAIPILSALLLAACEPSQLYLASHTVIGVNAAVNPEQTNGKLVIGYDRTFATVIPRSVDTLSGNTPGRDAMSAMVCSDLVVSGITIRRYTESLATGDAAQSFAAALKANPSDAKTRDFFSCFKKDGGTPPTQPGGGS